MALWTGMLWHMTIRGIVQDYFCRRAWIGMTIIVNFLFSTQCVGMLEADGTMSCGLDAGKSD